MHFASAIPIVITRPLFLAVVDTGVARVTSKIGCRAIRVEPHGCFLWNALVDQLAADVLIGSVQDPIATLLGGARNDTDNGWPVVLKRSDTFTLVRSSPRRVVLVAMRRAFFPPHFDTTRRPQIPFPPSVHLVRYQQHFVALVGAA